MVGRDTRGAGHAHDPPVTECPSLGGQEQAPLLLVQVWQNGRQFFGEHGIIMHTRIVARIILDVKLIS